MPAQSKTIIHARLKVSQSLGKKLEAMAEHREMKMDALLSQLVEVAVMHLEPKSAGADCWAREGDREHSTPGLPLK